MILFPGWARWAGCVIPTWRQVVYQVPDMDRQLVAYLTHLPASHEASLALRWDEAGKLVLHVKTYRAEGISSLPQLFQWAEWALAASQDSPIYPAPVKRQRQEVA